MRMNKTKGTHVLFTGLLLGILIITILLISTGYTNTWKIWGISVMPPYFIDFRSITAAPESMEQGCDPLVSNPADPNQRPMDYPRIWLTLGKMGVRQQHTYFFGFALMIFFFAGIYFSTPRKIDKTTAILLLAVIFSPATILGLETGNIDLLMFFLLSVAIYLLNSSENKRDIFAFAFIVIAFVLKLFPILALAVFLKFPTRKCIKYCLAGLILAACYAIFTWNDMVLIAKGALKGVFMSYGMNVFWHGIDKYNHSLAGIIHIVSIVAVIGCIIMAYLTARISSGLDSDKILNNENPQLIDSFRIGSIIYIITFLLGNNFDYRMIFLIFTIPQLIFWIKSKQPRISLISKVALASIIISMWSLFIDSFIKSVNIYRAVWSGFDEIINWCLFVCLIYLFSYSIPQWLKHWTILKRLPEHEDIK